MTDNDKILTDIDIETDLVRAGCEGISANHPATYPAVVSSQAVLREWLLAKRTLRNRSIVLPRHNRLLKGSQMGFVSCKG